MLASTKFKSDHWLLNGFPGLLSNINLPYSGRQRLIEFLQMNILISKQKKIQNSKFKTNWSFELHYFCWNKIIYFIYILIKQNFYYQNLKLNTFSIRIYQCFSEMLLQQKNDSILTELLQNMNLFLLNAA